LIAANEQTSYKVGVVQKLALITRRLSSP